MTRQDTISVTLDGDLFIPPSFFSSMLDFPNMTGHDDAWRKTGISSKQFTHGGGVCFRYFSDGGSLEKGACGERRLNEQQVHGSHARLPARPRRGVIDGRT